MSEITEEEIARAAKAAWDATSDEHNKWNCLSLDEQDDFTRFAGALLRPAIERAREGERERCAKVADAMAEDMTISIGKIGSQMLIDRYQVGANDMWAVAAAIRKG